MYVCLDGACCLLLHDRVNHWNTSRTGIHNTIQMQLPGTVLHFSVVNVRLELKLFQAGSTLQFMIHVVLTDFSWSWSWQYQYCALILTIKLYSWDRPHRCHHHYHRHYYHHSVPHQYLHIAHTDIQDNCIVFYHIGVIFCTRPPTEWNVFKKCTFPEWHTVLLFQCYLVHFSMQV